MANTNTRRNLSSTGRMSEMVWNSLLVGRRNRLRRQVSRGRNAAPQAVERLEERVLLSSNPIVVNTTDEAIDATPLGDGQVDVDPAMPGDQITLRAAIQEANSRPGHDTITLPAGTYTLARTGTGESLALTGDLDITDALTIRGAGTKTTIIDANGVDRVFEVFSNVPLTLSALTLSGGNTEGNGGGIYLRGTVRLDDCHVTQNLAGDAGGGLFVDESASLWVADSRISNNQATDGGGLFGLGDHWHVTVENSTIDSNSAADKGGGLDVRYFEEFDGSLKIRKSIVTGNSAEVDGGGILTGGLGAPDSGIPAVEIIDSAITNNIAGRFGGGVRAAIHNDGGAIEYHVVNTTISDNMAGTSGGGMSVFGRDFRPRLINTTITENTSGVGGGIHIISAEASVYLRNSIVAENSATIEDPDISNTDLPFVFEGPNLIGNAASANITDNGFTTLIGTAANPIDPLLAPLADNGGSTPTHALLSGSPAIDAGLNIDAPANDQRGAIRPVDGDGDMTASVDLGALEAAEVGSISGLLYHDLNENGTPDNDEPLLEKWVVYSDLNRNGQLDAGEPSTRTNAMGEYALDDLLPSEHAIVAQQNPGWRPTTPADAGTLEILDVLRQGDAGADGLTEPRGLALSPDGQNMYVAGLESDSLAVYSRDPLTGELAFVELFEHGVDGVEGLDYPINVRVSPDGRHVYVTARRSHAVAVFARNAETGQLTFLEAIHGLQSDVTFLDAPAGLSISNDGRHAYVASRNIDSVTVFERDSNTGHLEFVEILRNGVGGISGLGYANAVTVSPDDQYVYAGGNEDDTLVVFRRDETTGQLTLVETVVDEVNGVNGLGGIYFITVSPDSRHVYVASRNDDSIAVFHRNDDGTLTFIDFEHATIDPDARLDEATEVTVSPDGLNVYVAAFSGNAVNVFSRDPATGLLTFEQVLEDGVGGVDGLAGTYTALVSYDGRQVYASSNFDEALVTFTRVRPGEQLVELASDEDLLNVNFGSIADGPAGEITGRVWFDANANGVQDEGEFGIPNIRVQLQSTITDFDDPNDIAMSSITTDSEGNYRFEVFGTARRRVVLNDFPTINSVHFGVTPPEQSNNDTLDSDFNPTTGHSAEFVLTGGGSASSVDAGLVPVMAPVLRAPITATFDTTPTFEWSQAIGGARYDIWVNNLTTGQSGIIRDMDVAGTAFTPDTALSVGHSFIWTVRAYNPAGEPGPWAAHRTFTITSDLVPQGAGPAPRTIDTTPEFSWTAVPGADHYDLWVNDLTTGQSGIIRNQNVTGTRFESDVVLSADHDYIWTVRAISDNGATTEWAAHRIFKIDLTRRTTLLLPPGRTIATEPRFVWTEIPGADRYEIWVNDQTTGQFAVIRTADIDEPTFVPETPLVDGHSYVWTVRGFNEDGTATDWADHAYFTVDLSLRPTLTGPIGTAADATPTFSWTAVPGAERYDLWVNNLTTGQSGTIRVPNVSGTSYTPQTPLPGTDRFIWTVRGVNSSGEPGEWAAHRTFQFVTVNAPTLLEPPGTVATRTPVFRWTGVAGAARYEIWVNDLTTGQSAVIRTANITGTALQPANPLPNFHQYIWTVRAITAGGVTGPWAPHRVFSIIVTQADAHSAEGLQLQLDPSETDGHSLGGESSPERSNDEETTDADQAVLVAEQRPETDETERIVDAVLAGWPATDWWQHA